MIYLWTAAALIPILLPSRRPARLRRRRVAPVSHETAADSGLLTVNYCRNETRLRAAVWISYADGTNEGESLQLRARPKQKPWQAAGRLGFLKGLACPISIL